MDGITIYQGFLGYAKNVQANCLAIQGAGDNINPDDVLELFSNCSSLLTFANSILNDPFSTTVLNQYIHSTVFLDLSVVFFEEITNLQTLIAAIQTDFPKDANGHLLYKTFNGNTTFTAAQMPTVLPAITAFLSKLHKDI